MMKAIGSLLGFVLVLLLGLLLGTAVILAWALGFGWLLTLILPFTWFEASLLTLIASLTATYVIWRILQTVPSDFQTNDDLSTLFEPSIPEQRFHEDGKSDKRIEVWFRYEIANDLYWEFMDVPSIARSMDETEMKEVAIRLTDIVVGLFKQRISRARQVRITKTQLKRQMEEIGQRPYDDDILVTAVRSINDSLSEDDELADVVREKSWDEIDMDE